ncbi:MAG TPA: LPS export ABC transporter ATP-binding protein [Desulfobacteraceae bacterium]|nr:LPS export ABC transporter ATP-binding protein [Desulfobacteraceae bacterium]
MKTFSLQNLVKVYSNRKVVNSVTINIDKKSIVGLLGPNGAGKTTTFYMGIGMVKPDKGQIFMGDQEITDLPMYKRARKGIGYLPQEPSVFKKLTVRQNIIAVLEGLHILKSEQNNRADKLFEEFGISHLASQKAGLLSGGERRRLEITRVLATDPSFILLDEPFAGIDPLAVADIKQIIRFLKDKGIGVLISDHNVRETLEVCDDAYILNNGQVIESGTPEKIADSKTVRRIYLGDNFTL